MRDRESDREVSDSDDRTPLYIEDNGNGSTEDTQRLAAGR